MHLVERMQAAVIGVVNAYIDRLMREIEPALRARFDAESIPVGPVGGQVALGHQFLETTFRMVDRQAASDLARVIPVSTETVLPHAAKLQQEFIHNNTELIRMEERARAEVRKVVEGPLKEGIRVEEVRARIEERLGVVRSRAEFIARDQTLKLYGQIQQARQTQAGIVEYTWSTSEDERVRPTHEALDGSTQRWDDPPVVDPKTGRKAHPGGDFQCLPGRAHVGFSGAVNGAFRRWYAGELTTIVAAGGEALECTPNHPILTAAGWKPAKDVEVGDDVISAREHRGERPEADIEDRETSIAEIFEALALALGTTGARSVATQFHGDVLVDQEVDIVDVDGGLRRDLEAALTQRLRELPLADANSACAGLRQADLVLDRLGLAAASGVGALRLRLAQFLGRCAEAQDVGGAARAGLNAISNEQIADGLALTSVALGEALDRGTCSLQLQAFLLGQWLRVMRRAVHPPGRAPALDGELADRLLMHAQTGADLAPGQALCAQLARVVQVSGRVFHGHVYNLSTDQNWYVGAGAIVHNCRCAAIPILPVEGLQEQGAPPEPQGVTPPEPELVNEPANEVTPEPLPEPATELAPELSPAAQQPPPSSEPPVSSEPPTPRLRPLPPLEQLATEQQLTLVRSGHVEPEHEHAIATALGRLRLGEGTTAPLARVEITTRTGKAETAGQVRLPKGTGGVYFDSEWLRREGRDPSPALRLGVSPAHVDGFLALGRKEGRDIWAFRPSVSHVLPNGADVGRFDVPHNTQQLAHTAAEVIEMTATHEYAHHLHLAATNPEIDRLIQEAFRDRRSQPVSIYATEDPREFFAEAFTAYHHYPRAWLEQHTPKTLRLVERVLELSGLK